LFGINLVIQILLALNSFALSSEGKRVHICIFALLTNFDQFVWLTTSLLVLSQLNHVLVLRPLEGEKGVIHLQTASSFARTATFDVVFESIFPRIVPLYNFAFELFLLFLARLLFDFLSFELSSAFAIEFRVDRHTIILVVSTVLRLFLFTLPFGLLGCFLDIG
jgi:hypothetical protein